MEFLPVTSYSNASLKELIRSRVLSDKAREEIAWRDDIVEKLRKCFLAFNRQSIEDLQVTNVYKGGSLGRGTAVANKMDAELVVCFKLFTNIEQYRQHVPVILRCLKLIVKSLKVVEVERTYEYYIKCALIYNGRRDSLYIIPAVDFLYEKNTWRNWLFSDCKREIYAEMSRNPGDCYGTPLCHYTGCFTQLRTEFVQRSVRGHPELRQLMSLVNFWSQVNHLAEENYWLELLCICVYEEQHWFWRANLAENFRRVLNKLCALDKLTLSFDMHYKKADYSTRWTAPYVMDPTNPYQNTLPESPQDRNQFKLYAGDTLEEMVSLTCLPNNACTIQ